MALNENDYRERIYAFTREEWQPLIELIPLVENTSKFGEWAGGDKDEEGVVHFPYRIEAPIVHQFLKVVYGLPIIIDFDWGAWDEGRKIANSEDVDFDVLDLHTNCKLITAIVRNDRFCEGALASAFESGLMLRILKSIEKQIAGSKG